MSKRKCEMSLEPSLINVLNDDCLIEIFHRLPIVDRVRIERVCQRWKKLCGASWKNFKKIDRSRSTWGCDVCDQLLTKIEIDLSFLKKHHAGKFVTCVDFSSRIVYDSYGDNIITDIVCNCPNLEEVDFTGLKISKKEINMLDKNCSKIRKLSLGHFKDVSDKDLKALFSKNKNLSYLKIVEGHTINGSCLLALPADNMRELLVEDFKCLLGEFNLDYLLQAIHRLRNLKTISWDMTFCFINIENLDAIIKHASTLKNLRLNFDNSNKNFTMVPISKLVNLESLNLSCCRFLGDEVLMAVAETCRKIKTLDISCCESISNDGLAAVTTLPELECLNISYLPYVTDAILKNMPPLKVLKWQGYADGIANKGLLEYIHRSPELELLDLVRRKVSRAFMKAAAKVITARTNGIYCKTYYGQTTFEINLISNEYPFFLNEFDNRTQQFRFTE